jgi:methanogenic corrinoid protein MtbC1
MLLATLTSPRCHRSPSSVSGYGPRAVLACPLGEHHDIALLVFGIVLNRHGWRIDYLCANTPIDELAHTVDTAATDLVILAATTPKNVLGKGYRRACVTGCSRELIFDGWTWVAGIRRI